MNNSILTETEDVQSILASMRSFLDGSRAVQRPEPMAPLDEPWDSDSDSSEEEDSSPDEEHPLPTNEGEVPSDPRVFLDECTRIIELCDSKFHEIEDHSEELRRVVCITNTHRFLYERCQEIESELEGSLDENASDSSSDEEMDLEESSDEDSSDSSSSSPLDEESSSTYDETASSNDEEAPTMGNPAKRVKIEGMVATPC